MGEFTELVDLAAERLGGAVLWATDDFFAEKDNLLKESEAVFIAGKFTDRGKWMDGWESRRKRTYAESSLRYPDSDFVIVRLGLPGIVRGFVVDTAHFKGNYPKACAIEGASIAGHPNVEELLSDAIRWTPILEKTDLKGDSKNLFAVKGDDRFTHLRFHIYPDGGVARLRVHGDVVPAAGWLGKRERPQLVDAAVGRAGVVDHRDAHGTAEDAALLVDAALRELRAVHRAAPVEPRVPRHARDQGDPVGRELVGARIGAVRLGRTGGGRVLAVGGLPVIEHVGHQLERLLGDGGAVRHDRARPHRLQQDLRAALPRGLLHDDQPAVRLVLGQPRDGPLEADLIAADHRHEGADHLPGRRGRGAR